MRKVYILSKTFLLELLREKLIATALIVGGVLSLFSAILGSLSFAEKERIIFHLSFTAIHLVSLGIVVFFGSSTLHREIERQTCLLVLARPVSRFQFYIGKFFAISVLTLFIQLILLIELVLLIPESISYANLFLIFAGTFLEIMVILSIALFFSVLMSLPIALFATVGVFLLGNWLTDLAFFAKKSESSIFIFVADAVQWLTPNLYRLNWRAYEFLKEGLDMQNVCWGLLHALAWIVFLLLIGSRLWRKKDFA